MPDDVSQRMQLANGKESFDRPVARGLGAFDHDCEIKHAGRANENREAYAVRNLDVERCLRPERSVPSFPDTRLLDPLSHSNTMEGTVMPKSAPLQSELTPASAADATTYVQTNLVSDIAGLAEATDPHLVNPWGVSFRTGSPFWVSDQGTNSATLYAVTDSTNVNSPAPLFTVNIPTTAAGPQGPTGQVANTNTSSFKLTNGNQMSANFIFADLNGQISAWNGSLGTNGSTAEVEVTTPGAVYTGLAINQADTMLYAANTSAGTIDVFDSSFHPVDLGDHAFRTPGQIAARGLVPFNATDIGGDVYVTYAPAGRDAQTTAEPGDGAVAIFSESGKLEPHGVLLGGPHTPLAAPWGVAIAPDDFGQFGGDLLVGNFSFQASEINAFDRQTHQFEGTIPISPGSGQKPGGLWTLTFGGGGRDGSPSTLYFTDGIDGETHGLFGAIESVPPTGATQQLQQLAQATASFGSPSASENSNISFHVDETSQQSLTMPQHT